MTASLASSIRHRVAEDLAGPDASSLTGPDRKEFARQRTFAHLDSMSDEADGAGPSSLTRA